MLSTPILACQRSIPTLLRAASQTSSTPKISALATSPGLATNAYTSTQGITPVSLKNLIPIRSASYGKGENATTISTFKLDHADSVKRLQGQPEADIITVKVPSVITERFEAAFRTYPGISEFNPNFDLTEATLQKYEQLSAFAIYQLFNQHSPQTLDLLKELETAYKGLSDHHGPHVVIQNLPIGKVDTIPKSDDPKKDPDYFKAQAPYLSELFLLGMNKLLGFDRPNLAIEKCGGLFHHHVPILGFEKSATSVSSISSIFFHNEDIHFPDLYGHFTLLGKLGNPHATTPLMTLRSFMSEIPESDREWLIKGMHLPFLNRPGAGRIDDAAERLIAPILDQTWDGRYYLRFNGADYHSLGKTGEHIFRNNPLPKEWYPDEATWKLTNEALLYLRNLFKDVSKLTQTSPYVFPLVIGTGDLVFVGNKVGPHARTPFPGPRYLQRLYSYYGPERFWNLFLNFKNIGDRARHLASEIVPQLTPQQHQHLKQFQIDTSAQKSTEWSQEQIQTSSCLGTLDKVVQRLRYTGQNPFYLLDTQASISSLSEPLSKLSQTLLSVRKEGGVPALPKERLKGILEATQSCIPQLAPFVMNLTKYNLSEEMERIRKAGRCDLSPVSEQIKRLTNTLSVCVKTSHEQNTPANVFTHK
jgi:hypothetical protein